LFEKLERTSGRRLIISHYGVPFAPRTLMRRFPWFSIANSARSGDGAECYPIQEIALPRRTNQGVTIIELAVAAALLGLIAAAALGTLAILNKNAISARILTTITEILQRNIEAADGSPFTADNIPLVLAITPSGGSVWDDDGHGDNLVTIYTSRDGTAKMTGTLRRIVQNESNAVNADIRRVTFHLDYSLYGRSLSSEMTTIRAMDH
jgi:prepilin-type N-terminal cleavage/methylation domain-containing protein